MSAKQGSPVAIVVMGVQGTGKTTVGSLLAKELGVPFIDGDRLHPQRNIDLMASGHPLTDADRAPWLDRVGHALAESLPTGGAVIACSALRKTYRDRLRLDAPEAYFLELFGPMELIASRLDERTHEYMPHTLLQSQYDTLEPLGDDERGRRISVEHSPEDIVADVVSTYRQQVEELA